MRRQLRPSWVVVIASSSGGVQALLALVSQLPADLPAAVLIASHTPATTKGRLPNLLSAAGPLLASYPDDGQKLEMGRIFVAPPDRHLVVQGRKVRLTSGEKEHRMRPAADVLFRSAALELGARSMGIILSGGGCDGAAGLAAIKAAGGLALVQAPHDAWLATMPLSALAAVTPDACVPAAELGALVARLARERGTEGQATARRRTPRGDRRQRPLPLKGLRVFVAEDEYLIASEIVRMLRELGCREVGPVADVDAGRRVLEREHGQLDCAVLDVDLRGSTALPLASTLREQAIPFVFATGYGKAVLLGEWTAAPRLQKPYDARSLGAALRRALDMRWPHPSESPTPAPDIDYKAQTLKDARNLLMRSRALRASSSGEALMRSYEVMRQTHECIVRSARRTEAVRRVLRGWPASRAGGADDDDENG